MKPSKSRLIFFIWIDEYGIPKLAKALGVDPSTIAKWKVGHCPRPEQMLKIRELSSGAVTPNDIVDGIQNTREARQ